MSQKFAAGQLVKSTEHPKSIGTILEVLRDGALKIEWAAPRSESLPYGHIITEVWPASDHHLLDLIEQN